MEIYLLINDDKLQLEIEKSQKFKLVERLISSDIQISGAREERAVFIASDDVLDVNDLIQVRRAHPRMTMFYVVSLHADSQDARSVQALCRSHEITLIPPFRTPSQIMDAISETLFQTKRKMSNAVAAMSTIAGSGLTSSLLVMGKQLVEVCDIKVGIFGLNARNPGALMINYDGKYLDEIWVPIDSKYMQASDLMEKMSEITPNVYYLAGNRDILKMYTYTPEGVSYLIDLGQQLFDLLLLDLGDYIDSPLGYQGILSSDLLLVQANQDLYAKDYWYRLREQVLEREIGIDFSTAKNVWMICNKMYESPDVESDKHLQEEYGIPAVASLPYLNDFYRYQVRKNIMEMQNKKYLNEINRVADALIDYYSLPLKQSASNKRGFLPWRRK